MYVTDNLMKYERTKFGNTTKVVSSPLENFEIDEFNKKRKEIYKRMLIKEGLEFETGDAEPEESDDEDYYRGSFSRPKVRQLPSNIPIDGLVYVRHVTGLVRTKEGAYVKTYSKAITAYPMQMIVEDVINKDKRFKERPPIPIEDEFPKGSNVVLLTGSMYGSSATVLGHDNNKLKLSVLYCSTPEPTAGTERAKLESETFRYRQANEVARLLGISGFLLSRITSSFQIEGPDGKRYDIGLQMKYEGRKQKVLGYTKKVYRWEYSDLAIHLIKEYMSSFPDMFNNMVKLHGTGVPSASLLFGDMDTRALMGNIKEVRAFIKQKVLTFKTVSLHSDQLTKSGVAVVEQEAIKFNSAPLTITKKNIRNIPREAVLDPTEHNPVLSRQNFSLGDRVIYVFDSGNVSLYAKGTVVGIVAMEAKTQLQVVFDQPIMTGNRFDGRLTTQRGLTVDSTSLLNLTSKQFVYRKQPLSQKAIEQKKKALQAQKKHEKEVEKETKAAKKELLHKVKAAARIEPTAKKPEDAKSSESKKPDSESTSDNTTPSSSEQPPVHASGAQSIFNSAVNDIFANGGQQQQAQPQQLPVAPQGLPQG
ncbi:unnamed protein product [Ambrosiozyma monospora]|uniref:Unnamed protein product n=1 Tax=Ambrosiozyma monospora TaxID=43982 RepID=A0ACB5TKL8_AMBMO|nr:unnamed protein product [Ambrosiozyma monospora]